MRRAHTLLCLLAFGVLVTGCGIDGEPEKPEETVERGVKVSGQASVGVSF